MAKEAEAHSAEDKQKRDEIEARNQLDGLVYNIEKMLKENGDKYRAPTSPTWKRRWPMRRRCWKVGPLLPI